MEERRGQDGGEGETDEAVLETGMSGGDEAGVRWAERAGIWSGPLPPSGVELVTLRVRDRDAGASPDPALGRDRVGPVERWRGA